MVVGVGAGVIGVRVRVRVGTGPAEVVDDWQLRVRVSWVSGYKKPNN